ncbi:MAG: hypothetical protein H0W62_05100 [Chitinophagales bacterium]|nr:hypothetical protein [Chitinophagales bacterium]
MKKIKNKKVVQLILTGSAILLLSSPSFAQQSTGPQQTTKPLSTDSTPVISSQPYSGKSRSDGGDQRGDFQTELKQNYQRFQQIHQKLQQRESQTKDPEMKKDLSALDEKMKRFQTDMQAFMENSDNEAAKTTLRSEMQDIKKEYEALRSKYGTQKGQSKSGSDMENPR